MLRRHLEEEAVKSKSKKEVRTVPYQPERAVPCHPALYGSSAALWPPLGTAWVCRSLPYPSIPQRAWLTAAARARAYATAHRRQPRRFPPKPVDTYRCAALL